MRKKQTDIGTGTNLVRFGILMLFMVLVVPLVSANSIYTDPESITVDCSENTTVQVRFNTTETRTGVQSWIWFDPNCINITDVDYTGCPWQPLTQPYWLHWGDHVTTAAMNFAGVAPSDYPYVILDIECVGCGCASEIWFTEVRPDGTVPYNGTFTCGDMQTHTMSLPEGWNLISPPLTPTDNSVGTVLSGVTQNAVKLYNATTKLFEDVTTMDPGVGYFVHVTESGGSTWSYQGSPVSSTNPGLKLGLNMIGVPNCTMSVDTAMGSADYRYVARWDAAAQEYEVYNPSAPLSSFHGFTTMTAGEGYFVSAKSDGSLTISCP